jgi:hypothetical protein
MFIYRLVRFKFQNYFTGFVLFKWKILALFTELKSITYMLCYVFSKNT